MGTGGRKGKEKLIKDEGVCSKGNKADVTIYKRTMVNGKAKMVEDIGAVKRGKDRGIVIKTVVLLMMEEKRQWLLKGHWKQKNGRKKCEGGV
uniref:Uncharacterized protein n=1 Tax=Tanacetum cinerariifolium TaxID=118510 RepID=A0A699PZI6_TANCI|nr:hypothetical protein [Tanacetum cinerariifolium]